MTRKAVLIFKSPSTEDVTLEPYYKALYHRDYVAYFVPVLEDALCNEDELDRTVLAGPSTFAGVIITSGRAVKAWENSVRRIPTSHTWGPLSDWSRTPFYAVGPKTAEQMRTMSTANSLPVSLCPAEVRGAETTGTGERLAHFIVDDLNDRKVSLPLLYLTGDKVSDTIPNILRQADLSTNFLKVYETRPSSNFEADFTDVLRRISEQVAWAAFFSPSGVKTALPSLLERFTVQHNERKEDKPVIRLAVIGPTTATFLEKEKKLVVDAMAQKPDPVALAEAIADSDRKQPVLS